MSSKAEYKRTKKKLKERTEKIPEKVVVKPKHLKNVARNPEEAKEILMRGRLLPEGARKPLPPGWKPPREKGEETEYTVQTPPIADVPEVKMMNGIEIPVGLLELIKQGRDPKAAKKVARAANSWYRKLYGLEETRLVREFQLGDDVWWTKKGLANTGQVVRLKTRKLVVKAGVSGEHVVLPVRKVKKGQVPKEYLQPDPQRWAIGRKAA